MKVIINGKTREYQAIWMEDKITICAIDQRVLPFSFEIFKSKTIADTCNAIKEMVVRGAPLIGATAAYGLVQAAHLFKGKEVENFLSWMKEAAEKLSLTRPTAVDLFNTLELLIELLDKKITIQENILALEKRTQKIVKKTVEDCKLIGEIGSTLIEENSRIMTICNAGALATIDYGTALAPIRTAHNQGKKILVYVNETRPRMQGGRLTAWELMNEQIEHYIIPDSVAGYLMQQGKVDCIITGADRIVLNGDTANKIGTYTLSVLAKEHEIPFYVAAPKSSFDRKTSTGKEIKIEERDGDEIRKALSVENEEDSQPKRRFIHNISSANLNPAFDITPAKNITAIITPKEVLRPPYNKSIKKFLEEKN